MNIQLNKELPALLHSLAKSKKRRKKLQPFFHPDLLDTAQEIIDECAATDIKAGYQPRFPNVKELLEHLLASFVLDHAPEKIEERMQANNKV